MELSPDEKPAKKESNLPSEEYLAGTTLRNDIVRCLMELRRYKVKLFQRNRQKKLEGFETRLNELYKRFIFYDNDILVGSLHMLGGKHSLGDIMLKGVFSSQLNSQREMVRVLLQECDNVLSNHRNQINNLTATSIAILALVVSVLLGLFSLLVSLVQLYLSPDVTLPAIRL